MDQEAQPNVAAVVVARAEANIIYIITHTQIVAAVVYIRCQGGWAAATGEKRYRMRPIDVYAPLGVLRVMEIFVKRARAKAKQLPFTLMTAHSAPGSREPCNFVTALLVTVEGINGLDPLDGCLVKLE